MKNKKPIAIFLLAAALICTACGNTTKENQKEETDTMENQTNTAENQDYYEKITAKEAKDIMDEEQDFVILDVREEDEYAEGHVEGAVLLPLGSVTEGAEELVPDKDMMVLVYCRSGRRSKIAADELVELGYTNVKDFGGILDWPYDVVTE